MKLTLISIQPLSKETTNSNESQKIEKNSFHFQERQIIAENEKNIENKTSPSTKTTKNTEPIIMQSSKTVGTAAGSKSQKLRHRFFRLPETTAGLSKSSTDNFLGNDNAANNAASKLASLAKASSTSIPLLSFSFRDKNAVLLSNSKNNFNKSRNNISIFKSTSNLTNNEKIQPIIFNKEDDEIIDKENALFWNNLKSLKNNFTNTITLGRKFKRNVLKFNIFSSFSLNNNVDNKSNQSKSLADNNSGSNIFSNDDTLSSSHLHTKPPVNPKFLKKQKRLKELEKSLNNVTNKDKTLLKTCNNNSDSSKDKCLIYKTI